MNQRLEKRETWEVVRQAARNGEPDRYLAAILARGMPQAGLLALAAFAGELARIPVAVREPMMGEIRLQWWRDALASLGRGEETGHPVADALGRALRAHDLPLKLLSGIIDVRTVDIHRQLHPDDGALRRHLAQGEGALFRLAMAVLDAPQDAVAGPLAEAAGEAYGLARALMRLRTTLEVGGFPISAARLASVGLSFGRIIERPPDPSTVTALLGVLDDVRREALAALEAARRLAPAAGPAAAPALWPLAMVEPYLRAQSRLGSGVLEAVADVSPLRRVWGLWRASRSGRF